MNSDEEPNIDEWELIAEHPALQHLDIDAVKLARLWPDLLTGIQEEAAGARMLLPEREDRPSQAKRKKSRTTFYVAMAAAVAIPAAVGFQLFSH